MTEKSSSGLETPSVFKATNYHGIEYLRNTDKALYMKTSSEFYRMSLALRFLSLAIESWEKSGDAPRQKNEMTVEDYVNYAAKLMRSNYSGIKVGDVFARYAREMGMEMLVLDDGWFGKRNDDFAGLGDWVVNEKKLGCSMRELSGQIHALGLQFGLWFEPEMVNEDSGLYRAHPNWALTDPDRKPMLARNQLVLDMSRRDVVDYLFDAMCAVLDDGKEYSAWMFAAKDGGEALVNLAVTHVRANGAFPFVKLQGLIPEASYRLEGTEQVYSGAALMYGGYSFPLAWGDYPAHQLYFTRV